MTVFIVRMVTSVIFVISIAVYFKGGKSVVDDIKESRRTTGKTYISVLILFMTMDVMAIIAALLFTSFGFFTSLISNVYLITASCIIFVIFKSLMILTRYMYLGRNWNANITINDDAQIVTNGPYNMVRHPIYTFSIINYSLFCISFASLPVLILSSFMIISYFVLCNIEDGILDGNLAGYDEYKKSVKYKLIPYIY